MAAKDKGLQDRTGDELNTPDTEIVEADTDIHPGRDRDALYQDYLDRERGELKEGGYSDDEIREILGDDEGGEEQEGKSEEEEQEGGEAGEEGDDKGAGEEAEEGEKAEPEEESAEAEGEGDGGADAEAGAEKKAEPERGELKPEDVLNLKIPVKIDGKDGEVTISELQKSYQVQGHLTRQLQQAASYKQQLDNVRAQLETRAREMEEEFKQYEAQLFTEDEIRQRNRRREGEKAEKQRLFNDYSARCQSALYQRHPDADNLDYDPDFNGFREKHAPFLNEQLFKALGPGAFYPLMDVTLSYYKDVKTLWDALQQAQNATTSFKEEREAKLANREKEQRASKKKAKDVKPSTTEHKKAGGDEGDEPESPRDYVRSMMKKRAAAQGL